MELKVTANSLVFEIRGGGINNGGRSRRQITLGCQILIAGVRSIPMSLGERHGDKPANVFSAVLLLAQHGLR